MKLYNKVAVITGAAKGIGKCIGQRMAQEGAAIAILDFDEILGKKTEQDFKKQGVNALFIKTDVSDYDSLKESKNKVIDTFGKVDILVINAGISIKHSIKDISIEEWDKVLKINLSGSFYTVKAYYSEFENKTRDDNSRIIFVTSGSAITGTGGGAHYASSKSGQHGLMRNLSKELGPKGVNVNAIAPRVIVTELFEQLYPTEESKEDLVKKIPIGRFGYPEDIANLACFLASNESSYIHGQIMLMDGGRTY